ncbi:hypothetical protein CPB85DRAFT_1341414 [Mucidula mucida]|nr:hypothetical protein CPB85DRAFT_1341414 [Mucidula mucida]
MCVPISPASEHPLGRPSLPISKPLPWSNCYQTTTDDFDVLLEPQDLDYSSSPEFSARTDRIISRYTSEDGRRINAMEAECTVPAPDGKGPPACDGDEVSIQSDTYAPDISDDVDAVENIFFSSIDDPMWNKIFTPAVKVNPDLTIIKTLSDPAELWDEHAALKRIVDACKARRRDTSLLPPGERDSGRPRGLHITLMSKVSKLAANLKRTRTKIVRQCAFKTVQSVAYT